ncbi:MAG: hypothetical protein M3P27_06645 [Acidobacteriota bacterium]|nr:hypothetical protein [Acidobacteriota bacterium]
MPDTGEAREIRRLVNAKEAEVVAESKKLLAKLKPADNRAVAGRGAKKNAKKKGR